MLKYDSSQVDLLHAILPTGIAQATNGFTNEERRAPILMALMTIKTLSDSGNC
tara:strand:- start:808 stop:966 length:159 start_codon:yes stop_codon:yes gene_type:complete